MGEGEKERKGKKQIKILLPSLPFSLSPLCTWGRLSLFHSSIRDPLEPPRFVDDPFEQPLDRTVVERPHVHALHVAEYFRLARRLIEVEPGQLLLVADG